MQDLYPATLTELQSKKSVPGTDSSLVLALGLAVS